MTIQELSKYHDLKIEVNDLKNQINEIESFIIGSSKMTGMPSSKNVGNHTEDVAIKLASLTSRLDKKMKKSIEEYNKIEDYLNTVDDVQIRNIIRKRFIKLKNWDVVANELNMSRTTPYKMLIVYLKKDEKR